MRFAHDYLDNQEVKREEYFLLPTSYLLTRLPACSFSITSPTKGYQTGGKLYVCVQLLKKFA